MTHIQEGRQAIERGSDNLDTEGANKNFKIAIINKFKYLKIIVVMTDNR